MGLLHAALAWLAAASVAAVFLAALPPALRRSRSYRVLDAVLLVQAGVTGLAALAGLRVLLTAAPPSDALHVLYGATAAALPLLTRIAAQGRPAATVGRWVAVAALVAAGATVRSFMTGT